MRLLERQSKKLVLCTAPVLVKQESKESSGRFQAEPAAGQGCYRERSHSDLCL